MVINAAAADAGVKKPVKLLLSDSWGNSLYTMQKPFLYVYNGAGLACGASERFDVVSDLLWLGPGGRLLHAYVQSRW